MRMDGRSIESNIWLKTSTLRCKYGHFFKKFTSSMNYELFMELHRWFFQQVQFDNYTLDVDSSVITRYDMLEGSKFGYNPKKPGHSSYHHLFAFVNDIRMVVNC